MGSQPPWTDGKLTRHFGCSCYCFRLLHTILVHSIDGLIRSHNFIETLVEGCWSVYGRTWVDLHLIRSLSGFFGLLETSIMLFRLLTWALILDRSLIDVPLDARKLYITFYLPIFEWLCIPDTVTRISILLFLMCDDSLSLIGPTRVTVSHVSPLPAVVPNRGDLLQSNDCALWWYGVGALHIIWFRSQVTFKFPKKSC